MTLNLMEDRKIYRRTTGMPVMWTRRKSNPTVLLGTNTRERIPDISTRVLEEHTTSIDEGLNKWTRTGKG